MDVTVFQLTFIYSNTQWTGLVLLTGLQMLSGSCASNPQLWTFAHGFAMPGILSPGGCMAPPSFFRNLLKYCLLKEGLSTVTLAECRWFTWIRKIEQWFKNVRGKVWRTQETCVFQAWYSTALTIVGPQWTRMWAAADSNVQGTGWPWEKQKFFELLLSSPSFVPNQELEDKGVPCCSAHKPTCRDKAWRVYLGSQKQGSCTHRPP